VRSRAGGGETEVGTNTAQSDSPSLCLPPSALPSRRCGRPSAPGEQEGLDCTHASVTAAVCTLGIGTCELGCEQGFSISELGCSLCSLWAAKFLQFLHWLKFSRRCESVPAVGSAAFPGRRSPHTTSDDG